MGNEQSQQISGIEIDTKAIEVSDFWAQHNAYINNLQNSSRLSIFIGDLFINEPFWLPQTPLECFSKVGCLISINRVDNFTICTVELDAVSSPKHHQIHFFMAESKQVSLSY